MAAPPIPIDPTLRSWPSRDRPTAEFDIFSLPSTGLSLSSDHRRRFSRLLNDSDLDAPSRSASLKPLNDLDIEPISLVRFCRETDTPWSTQHIGGGGTELSKTPMDPNFGGNPGRSRRSFPNFNPYHDSSGLEGERSNPTTYPADSGYDSRSIATGSVPDVEYASQSYERQSIPGDVPTFTFIPSEQALYTAPQLGQESPYAPVRAPVGEGLMPPPADPLACQVDNCGWVSKNQSEAR